MVAIVTFSVNYYPALDCGMLLIQITFLICINHQSQVGQNYINPQKTCPYIYVDKAAFV